MFFRTLQPLRKKVLVEPQTVLVHGVDVAQPSDHEVDDGSTRSHDPIGEQRTNKDNTGAVLFQDRAGIPPNFVEASPCWGHPGKCGYSRQTWGVRSWLALQSEVRHQKRSVSAVLYVVETKLS